MIETAVEVRKGEPLSLTLQLSSREKHRDGG